MRLVKAWDDNTDFWHAGGYRTPIMAGLARRGLAPASRSEISLKVLLLVREPIALDKLNLALVDGFTGSSEPRGMPEYPFKGSIKVEELP